jgi:hypothetical protein
MTSKASADMKKQSQKHEQSLKGTLADVLAKAPTERPREQNPEKGRPRDDRPAPSAPMQQPASPARPPEPPQAKKPFEVPEHELRKILNGET